MGKRARYAVIGISAVLTLALLSAIVFRIGWVTFVENYELAFQYDQYTGKIEVINRTGYIVRGPIHYSVHTIDLRPYQLSITPSNYSRERSGSGGSNVSARVLNAKLVKFNPQGLETFLAWHGRTAGDNLDNLLEIMKCYAFDKTDGRDCPFITVISELAPSQTVP